MNTSKPSIHVIISGSFSKNGNFIGRDDDFNTIFIPQNVLKSADFNSLSDINFPFYSMAHVETYNKLSGNIGDRNRKVVVDENGKQVKFKRLTSYFISPTIDNIFRAFTMNLSLYTETIEITFEPKEIIQSLDYLQKILIKFSTYWKKIVAEKDKSLFTQLVEKKPHNRTNDIEIIVPGFACTDIWHELINGGGNIKNISIDDWFKNYCIYDYSPTRNYLTFSELYLFTELGKSRIDAGIKRRILKLDDFKQLLFDQDWKYYLTQYYHLKPNPIIDGDETEYLESFERERCYDFRERCKAEFDEHKLYSITPGINEATSTCEMSKIHNEIILLVENLYSCNIFNVIILPPSNDLNYKLQMNDEANNNEENDYCLFDDLANEEISRMDEETDGYWRIANDLG